MNPEKKNILMKLRPEKYSKHWSCFLLNADAQQVSCFQLFMDVPVFLFLLKKKRHEDTRGADGWVQGGEDDPIFPVMMIWSAQCSSGRDILFW